MWPRRFNSVPLCMEFACSTIVLKHVREVNWELWMDGWMDGSTQLHSQLTL